MVLAVVKEERSEGIGASVEISLDAVGGGFRNEDGAIFLPFSADDKFATVEVDAVAVELD